MRLSSNGNLRPPATPVLTAITSSAPLSSLWSSPQHRQQPMVKQALRPFLRLSMSWRNHAHLRLLHRNKTLLHHPPKHHPLACPLYAPLCLGSQPNHVMQFRFLTATIFKLTMRLLCPMEPRHSFLRVYSITGSSYRPVEEHIHQWPTRNGHRSERLVACILHLDMLSATGPISTCRWVPSVSTLG